MQVDTAVIDDEAVDLKTECENTFNMLLTFLKDLIGKSEEF